MTDGPPARAASPQHPQRAPGRGVAVLHQVGLGHGLPVRARPRSATGARGEQAAAPHGPADRVLHPDRRARPRSVRRRRRDAARGGHRPRAAARARASSSSRAGSAVYEAVVARPVGRARRARARCSPTSARPTRAGRGRSTRAGSSCASATRSRCCPSSRAASVDFVATDPPYNIQLPMTMAGGEAGRAHANRRTDYAMVTDAPGRPGQQPPTTRRSSTGWRRLRRAAARAAARALRGRHRPRRLPGRPLPVHRLRPRGAGRRGSGSCPRAT